jgi:hypothetical protein
MCVPGITNDVQTIATHLAGRRAEAAVALFGPMCEQWLNAESRIALNGNSPARSVFYQAQEHPLSQSRSDILCWQLPEPVNWQSSNCC